MKPAIYPGDARLRRDFSLRNSLVSLLLTSTFLLGASVSVPAAQDVEDDSTAEPVPARVEANSQEMDEITVKGTRSLVSIERQIQRAEQKLYGVSNPLIDDPLYKVFCLRESTAGSNIKKRICRPGFERDLASDRWEDEKRMGRQGGNNYTFDYNLPEAELRKHREIFKHKLMELAVDNPNLAEAIFTRAKLQRDYAQERQRQLEHQD